jgi:hypothetical protein
MSNASNLSTLANVLDDGSSGQFLKSTGSGGVAFDTVAAGAVVYATAALLPLSGNSAGDMAYVTATNRFYINNGSGWYSVSLVNTNPNITSVADASSNTTPFILASDGSTATVVTITANDPESVPLTYSYGITNGSLNGCTVTGADGTSARVAGTAYTDNVFTVTPHASNEATFTLTFTASDGINQATSANAFTTIVPRTHIGDRMVVAGGNSPATSAIRYIDLTGSGGSTSFGSLTSARNGLSGASDGSRGVFAGGVISNYINNIDYVTIATPGNSTDFGDLTTPSIVASASDGTTAMFGMFQSTSTYAGYTSQITIATTGNATARSGGLDSTATNGCGASDGDRGFFFGGYTGGRVNNINYLTIATSSWSSDWGDLTSVRYQQGQSACGTSSRVLHAGGNDGITYTNTIEYINPASAGNATDFGDLTVGVRFTTSACNSTKACWVGGGSPSGIVNTQQIVTIDTAANATTFGTYNAALQSMGALSGAS